LTIRSGHLRTKAYPSKINQKLGLKKSVLKVKGEGLESKAVATGAAVVYALRGEEARALLYKGSRADE